MPGSPSYISRLNEKTTTLEPGLLLLLGTVAGNHHHRTLSIAPYGSLLAQRLKSGQESRNKKYFVQRQMPSIPNVHIPRGSPTQHAQGHASNPITTLRFHPGIALAIALGHCT